MAIKSEPIEKSAYEAWAKDKFIEYASRSVQHRPGINKRLVFGVFVGGGFKVTSGHDVLYEGGSFSAAQAEFNAAV